jgi:RNA polymerase sigma-70 factor (ECF subfamily)
MLEQTMTVAAPALNTAALYNAHAADVSRWVRSLAGPDAEVEDLVQEVFIVAHRSTFRADSAVTTWLFGIAANLVKQHRRVQKVRQWLGGSANEVAGHVPSAELSSPEVMARRQAQARVYRVLDTLKEKQRTALILFELEGRPAAEIAELYGVTPSVVWVWLSRARAQFHKQLEVLERSEGVV